MFFLTQADVCELPSDLFVAGEDMFVGLGWDTRCDLDAGVMITDKALFVFFSFFSFFFFFLRIL